ncbi:sodium:solute symporter [Variovorax sp. J22P271]|uniref:sodium:solute symporter family protein n=1 Tax=Variovorax davisae TaxID=3053515 RepID=UPI0025785900|nr:sodium:solute symporter [Variovorax sp. J22P271]MDM0033654.1 sodium:solute symporter [Variovorax sp. J22P271]
MNAALAIISLTLVGVLLLGLRARHGVRMDLEQWSVGGRGFSGRLVFVLMAGELYTTFTFLGASGFAYGHGGPAFYIMAYSCLAFVLSYWLLPAIWRFARQHRVLTQPEFFAKAYDSPSLGFLVSAVALLALVPYLVLQLKGLGIIVELTSYGSLDASSAIWIGAVAMTAYVILSGLHGSASTAALKDVLILAVCVFLGLYLPHRHDGGVGEMFRHIEQQRPGFLALPATGKSGAWFVSTVALSALGMYLWPHAFTATFTASSERSFRRNAMVMPLYALVMLFSMFAGFAALLQIPALTGDQIDLALLKLSIQTFDPWVVGVIGAAGMLTAIVPGSIMLVSAATLVARDLYRPARPASSDAHLSMVSRGATLLLMLAAVALTLAGGVSIVSLLLMGFSFVTQLAPALLAALAGTGAVNRHGAFAGILAGVAFVAGSATAGLTMKRLLPAAPEWTHDVNLGIVGLALNVLVMFAVSLLTRGRGRARNLPPVSPAPLR